MIDPYKVLGIPNTATQDEIKHAYRALVKKYHPDLNPGNTELEAKFKEVSTAYAYIDTPEAREKFDRGETPEQMQEQEQERAKSYYNAQRRRGRPSQNFGQDMGDDFFENLFRRPGPDHLYKLEVEFREAALGSERELNLTSGQKLLVKIPAGITSGTKLKFKGRGGPGTNNGPSGDAFVEIIVRNLQGFSRVGKNIEMDVPISFQEALLGGEIKITTLDGSVILKIQAGVSTGSKLRLPGLGAGAKGERGDLIVSLKVVIPTQVTSELQEEIKSWNGKYDYNPRAEKEKDES
jgi:DnaJ-class molecular chaperone